MSDPAENSQTLFHLMTVEEKPASFSLKELVTQFPDHKSDWTIPEAFLCLILSAAFADGRVAQQELEEIRALAHRSRTLKNLDENELAHANNVVLKRRADRPEWLSEACETLPTDMRLSVFAHCLDISLADGVIVQAEADFLEQLIKELRINREDARLITKVISLKHRY
ncbi:MAG TPA: tellurite resistance TerB family protein [Hyphomonas sp.]|nr:tellurite resistance TerB family protein [Hyphomonas sp.]MCB9961673.1 tellurite resistance TerB family protein [Hyphomonas sp.]MCB9971230.1 tellurite resistance TerB family protein [Hyphomonas sp.]MCC0050299.1 tellurite resistance TerB family protein [Rhodobiaceae bacterium]HPE48203.1 tellurite resistance TerB family protein [Hyphomonas sp.]